MRILPMRLHGGARLGVLLVLAALLEPSELPVHRERRKRCQRARSQPERGWRKLRRGRLADQRRQLGKRSQEAGPL